MQNILKKISFLDFIVLLSTVFIGGFNEYFSAVISVFLSCYLFYRINKTKKFIFNLNLFSVSIVLISLFYGLSSIWAVDSGTAFIGFLKFLPLTLFLTALCQENNTHLEDILPFLASILTVISVIGMYIEFTKSFFTVAGRLAGFFEYPNTFALFLLISELLLLSKQKFKIADYIYLIILFSGILYTGSRTVFVIFAFSNFICFIYKLKNSNKKRYYFLALAVVLVLGAVILILNKNILNRYLSISVLESTFIGRILYFSDAAKLIIKYPFGSGYLGYSYLQTGIQTGVYTVKYVHNDFLQLILDIGFIPLIVFIIALIRVIIKKDTCFYKKVIILSICVHSLFDFNLQFISIFLILIVLCNYNGSKTITISKSLPAIYVSLAIIILINTYMGAHLILAAFNKNHTAQKLYPFNTENMIAILEKETDITEANNIAEKIIKQNKESYIPYSIKAKYCYSIGDITNLMYHKREVFKKNPFGYDEYEEYCQMLIACISKYYSVGDKESAQYCIKELFYTQDLLAQNKSLLSELGSKIKDQPHTELPDEILYYINEFSEIEYV